jgi:60S ribosome subunit biogenesis protein NIP7
MSHCDSSTDRDVGQYECGKTLSKFLQILAKYWPKFSHPAITFSVYDDDLDLANHNCLHKPSISANMRPLTDVETQTLFTKLANYTGRSLTQLIAPSDSSSSDNDRHLFRLHESRVYYVRLSLASLATSISRDNLLCLGTCIGKFTKTGKFRLHITALDIIAPHARYKLWIKQNGEMPFLYGGNVLKAHVGRWSDDCPEHSGCVVYSMDDMPLGFGVTARGTAEARKADPMSVVVFRQGDVGEYLREEDTLFAT